MQDREPKQIVFIQFEGFHLYFPADTDFWIVKTDGLTVEAVKELQELLELEKEVVQGLRENVDHSEIWESIIDEERIINLHEMLQGIRSERRVRITLKVEELPD